MADPQGLKPEDPFLDNPSSHVDTREIIAVCAEEISANWKWNRWSTEEKRKKKKKNFKDENSTFLSNLQGKIFLNKFLFTF